MQDLNLRVLIANSAAAAAATSQSAQSSPKKEQAREQEPSPFSNKAMGDGSAGDAVAQASAEKAEARASDDSELAHLQKLVSSEGGTKQAEPGPDSGHLLGSSSGRTSPVGISEQPGPDAAQDAGHMLASFSSSTHSWERAHSAPVLPKLGNADLPQSHTVHLVDSMASLAADDGAESVLSAPGNVEMPVTFVQAALEETDLPLRAAAASVDPSRGKSAGGGGIVSRYVAMFEAHKPAISMPAWQRHELRGRSTDLVLRFLNRHRRPRARQLPPAETPEGAAADGADAAPTHHHSDSDENSGSEDEEEDGRRVDEHGRADSDSEGFRTPPRAHSPVRGRPCSTGSPSGTPVHPSRLGDASRAAVADHVSVTAFL